MGESDNKPAGKHDLLEEDGTVWMSGGPTGALDDDDDDDLAEPPAHASAGTPKPAAPVQPFTRMPTVPHALPVALRAAPPAADLADRPIAASGEMSSTPRGPTAGRSREPTPIGAEPKIELDTSFGVVSDTPFGAPETPYVAPERRSAPMTSMFGETGRVAKPALSAAGARWQLIALLALLALVIAALVWRIAAR